MSEICISYPDLPFWPGARVIINNKVIDSKNLERITLRIQRGKAPNLELGFSGEQEQKEKDILD